MTKKKKHPIICAFDTEVIYDTRNKYSIGTMGSRQFVEDPRHDCYLCQFANDDFTEAAHPSDIDWFKYQGATFICHNASFDEAQFIAMVEKKVIPPIDVTFICSADMCSYFQLPRALAQAVKVVFKHDMPKEMRDWMNGKTWQDAVDEGKSKELLEYGINDVIWTWKLYKKLYKKWPEIEREISRISREMSWEGLPVDVKLLRKSIKSMEKQIWEIQQRLPWHDQIDPDTKKPYAITGKKGLNTYLKKEGLPTIKSTAKDSTECEEWITTYGARCTYVSDFQTLVRINKHYSTLKTLLERVDSRDRFTYSLLYCGVPSTQRFKGAGGWSVHNAFPREVKYGVDVRSMIRAPKGHKLIVSDLSNIEPRCAAKICGDEEALQAYFEGANPYQYHAEETMNWTGGQVKKEDPALYALAKERVLSLGYGVGWQKFLSRARQFGFGDVFDKEYDKFDENSFIRFLDNVPSQAHLVDVFDAADDYEKRCMVNAWIQVMDFRAKQPLIKGLWDKHAENFGKAAGSGKKYEIPLLSGRKMTFFKPRSELQGISCKHTEGGKERRREYGASLYQKSVQATARDVFIFHLYNLHQRGVKVIMHVHDEVVVEAKESEVEATADIIKEVMTTSPPWAELPLESDCVITDTYLK